MSARIVWEAAESDGTLRTARPDSFWCALVDEFAPEKGTDGDGDPYGAGVLRLGRDDVAALHGLMGKGWWEVAPLIMRAAAGPFLLHREV